MNILINALSAIAGGNVTGLRRLIPALLSEDRGQHTYVALTTRAGILPIEHERFRIRVVKTRGRSLLRAVEEQALVPILARAEHADLLFSPGGLAAVGARVPQVLMFQNAAPFTPAVIEMYRDAGRRFRMPLLRQMGIWSARVADRIIFISDGQRALIEPQLGIAHEKTARVYLGRNEEFAPEARAAAGPLLERYGIAAPYVLSVSHFYRYQQLVELVDGFSRAAPALSPEVRLVLAGPILEQDYADRVREIARLRGIAERVVLTGPIAHGDLPGMYASAELFVFPTICESFPITLVEAMACGAPTLAADVPPMPELAGDGARYFRARSSDDLGAQLAKLWNDRDLRKALRARGPTLAARYTWTATARDLLGQFESLRQ